MQDTAYLNGGCSWGRKCVFVQLYGRSVFRKREDESSVVTVAIIIIIIIIIITIDFSLGGSSPYTSTDKTNKNKYT
jgi:hypothetical protein